MKNSQDTTLFEIKELQEYQRHLSTMLAYEDAKMRKQLQAQMVLVEQISSLWTEIHPWRPPPAESDRTSWTLLRVKDFRTAVDSRGRALCSTCGSPVQLWNARRGLA